MLFAVFPGEDSRKVPPAAPQRRESIGITKRLDQAAVEAGSRSVEAGYRSVEAGSRPVEAGLGQWRRDLDQWRRV